jgi:hypothetical protein
MKIFLTVCFTVHEPFLIFNDFLNPFAVKLEPDEIEMFCFMPLKAQLYGFPAASFEA